MIAIKIRKKLEDSKFKGKLCWFFKYQFLLLRIKLAAYQRYEGLEIPTCKNLHKNEYIKYKLKKEGFTVNSSRLYIFIKW